VTSRPTVIDLFCGVGGLSLGFLQAKVNILAAFDSWEAAVNSYNANFTHRAQCIDIGATIDLPRSDIIIGGPPCQGFSSAGLRRPDDRRNSLVKVFAELVARHRPRAFLFENVEGFLTGAKGRHIFELLEPIIDAGYRVHVWKLNAANYGIPQHRKRVIAIGGLGWNPSFPQPTHSAYGAPGAHLAGSHLPKAPTVLETLQDLPPAVQRSETPHFSDHIFVPLSEEDLCRARLLAPGQCMRDLPEEYWHSSYRRRAFRRVMDGIPTERRGGAPAGLRRLCGDEPSKAITGGALNEFLHPTYDRALTIRECARLQTFPDDFKFPGRPTDAMQLIGNAVPPRLAFVLATSLTDDLSGATLTDNEGALLSFVPTLANGMSPALGAVTREVRRRFRTPAGEYQMNLQWS
jgi:DNA (cytosine-5)-methyltransferase 1